MDTQYSCMPWISIHLMQAPNVVKVQQQQQGWIKLRMDNWIMDVNGYVVRPYIGAVNEFWQKYSAPTYLKAHICLRSRPVAPDVVR